MGGGLISEIKRFEKYRVHFCTFQILKKNAFYFDFASFSRISK